MAEITRLPRPRCPECHSRLTGAALDYQICTRCSWDGELAALADPDRLDLAARRAVEGPTDEARA